MKHYPVLPLRNTVLFPSQIIPIYIGRKQSLDLIADVSNFEDKTIIDPKIKSELFGQYDHVRKYGKDFYDRLKSVGFKVKKIDVQKNLSEKEIKEYSLPKYEKIPFVIKS